MRTVFEYELICVTGGITCAEIAVMGGVAGGILITPTAMKAFMYVSSHSNVKEGLRIMGVYYMFGIGLGFGVAYGLGSVTGQT